MINWIVSLFEISLTMSLVIILCLCLRPFFSKRFKAVFKYWVWLVIAIRLIVPFNITIPTFNNPIQIENKLVEIPRDRTVKETVQTGTMSSATKIQSQNNPVVIEKNPTISILVIVQGIWLVGLLLYLGIFGFKHLRFIHAMNKGSKVIRDEHVLEILSACQKELGISKKIKFKQCRFVGSPLLVGLFNPEIILPSVKLQDQQLIFVLKHELLHYKNYDLFYQFILFMVSGIHWFNPIVHKMVSVALEDIEQACDERVVSNNSIKMKQDYGYTILEIAKNSNQINKPLVSSFGGNKKTLKERLIALGEMNKKTMNRPFLFMLLVLVVVSSCLVGCEVKEEVASTPSPEVQEAIYYNNIPQGFWEESNFSNEYGYQITLVNVDDTRVYVQVIKRDLIVPKYVAQGKFSVEGRDIYQFTFEQASDLIYDDVLKKDFALPQPGDSVTQWESGEYFGVVFGATTQNNIGKLVSALKISPEIEPRIDITWYYVVSDNYRYYTLGDDDLLLKVPNDLSDDFIIFANQSEESAMIQIQYAPFGLSEGSCSSLFASIMILKNTPEAQKIPGEIYAKTDKWIIFKPEKRKSLDIGCDVSSEKQLNAVKEKINEYKDINLIEIVER